LSNYREKLCLSTGKYNNIYIDYCCVSSEPRFHSHAARQPRSHSHVFLRELVTSRLASVDIPYLEVNGIKRLFFLFLLIYCIISLDLQLPLFRSLLRSSSEHWEIFLFFYSFTKTWKLQRWKQYGDRRLWPWRRKRAPSSSWTPR